MSDDLAPRMRTAARATAIGAGVAVTAAVPLTFPADGGPSALDSALADPITAGLSPGAGELLVAPSSAPVVLALLLAACGWFVVRRQWWRAATMLAVPELAVAINTWVLKPLWDRQLHDYPAYPSGHTVHLVAVATTFVFLATSRAARITVALVTALAVAATVPGMVELGYHHPTDVLGGVAAAVAVATTLCVLAEWRRAQLRS
ncbi:phosphatase PAP2 family protein [Nocardia rhizosphaerae]|uniref:Phosphatase PAP2 family protein n=1 Tax=Nocardia rhizosphaerae TaxID=1691571 RepID=A0ABV8LCK3_9NOCA